MLDKLLSVINKYPNGTNLITEWDNGLKIRGKINTIYETDNGREMGEDGYQEYYACVFNVLDILTYPTSGTQITVGSLIEISMQDPPKKVILEDGTVIWEKNC